MGFGEREEHSPLRSSFPRAEALPACPVPTSSLISEARKENLNPLGASLVLVMSGSAMRIDNSWIEVFC